MFYLSIVDITTYIFCSIAAFYDIHPSILCAKIFGETEIEFITETFVETFGHSANNTAQRLKVTYVCNMILSFQNVDSLWSYVQSTSSIVLCVMRLKLGKLAQYTNSKTYIWLTLILNDNNRKYYFKNSYCLIYYAKWLTT